MTEKPTSGDRTPTPRNVLPDLIIPVMALAFAIYYLTTITEVPWIAQASAVLVSGLLLLAILAFAVRTIIRLRLGTEMISFGAIDFDYRNNMKRVGLLVLTVAYVWFIEDLGFTISTVVFLFLAIVLLSSPWNWKNAALVSISCSLIGYFIFIFVFETRFPKGPVENFLAPYAKSIKQALNDR
ncbi:MAG: tripartite tricarboxylate transporter TctB family protein [Pseudomonadota bacterium]